MELTLLTLALAAAVPGCRVSRPPAAALRAQADRLFAEGRYNEAYAAYVRLAKRNPKDADAFVRLAECSFMLGDPDRGLKWIDAALKLEPSARAWDIKGRLLLQAGKPQAAIQAFRQALALDGRFNQARLDLAVAYQLAGRLDQAVATARQATLAEPDSADAFFVYGQALEAAGKLDEAEAAYRRAAKLAPDDARPLLRIASLLIRQGKRLTEARRLAQKANDLDPGEGEALVLAAQALIPDDIDVAIRELVEVVRAHPLNSHAWQALSEALRAKGDLRRARIAAAMAAQVAPKQPLHEQLQAIIKRPVSEEARPSE